MPDNPTYRCRCGHAIIYETDSAKPSFNQPLCTNSECEYSADTGGAAWFLRISGQV